jgi:hypothetical protein
MLVHGGPGGTTGRRILRAAHQLPQFRELRTQIPYPPGFTHGVPLDPSRIWTDLLVCDPKTAMALARQLVRAGSTRWVNCGLVDAEYRDYVRNGRQR